MTSSKLITAISLIFCGVPVCMGLLHAPSAFNLRTASLKSLWQSHPLRKCSEPLYSSKQNSAQKLQRPPNEFSRVYDTEAILTTNNREYRVNLSASADELQALCRRFDLPEIKLLSATLSIRKHSAATKRRTTSAHGIALEVHGHVQSQFKQTCVRTGQPFDVDLKFPMQVAVRPILSASSFNDNSFNDDKNDSVKDFRKQRYPQKQSQQRSVDEINMVELQRLLQDIDLSEDVFEDDAIFDIASKRLDVGELVAQCFFQQLDPYPKKPGTDPIRISISG